MARTFDRYDQSCLCVPNFTHSCLFFKVFELMQCVKQKRAKRVAGEINQKVLLRNYSLPLILNTEIVLTIESIPKLFLENSSDDTLIAIENQK